MKWYNSDYIAGKQWCQTQDFFLASILDEAILFWVYEGIYALTIGFGREMGSSPFYSFSFSLITFSFPKSLVNSEILP